ncbi:MAG: hypothetical protein SD837_12195 [Candidatus Electrothrix scaldis]|nr:MAG: hypothetical protein SD837_12195 [Candidatus Electrothrix sp. GW3-3]
MEQTAILLLAANPDDTARLRIGSEIEAIKESLRMTRPDFIVEVRHAATVDDVSRCRQRIATLDQLLKLEEPMHSIIRFYEWVTATTDILATGSDCH